MRGCGSPGPAFHPLPGCRFLPVFLPDQGTRPHGHRRDRSQPQAEAQDQDPGRHRSLRLGPRTAQRSHRGVGVVSSQSCPRPCAPTPAARSRTRFIYHRGPPTRTHVSRKRGKWSRIAGVRRSHTRVPGWAHKRPMGSSQEEQPLHLPSQSGQDADLLDAADTARPQASLLERHLPEGERQLHGSGQGPYFYIGGTNGASIISSYCKGKGWQRIEDSRREDYKLKWCEVKCRDSYYSFREGEQLLYQLPNNKLLTTKIGLLSALREYSRVVSRTHKTSPCAQAKHPSIHSPHTTEWPLSPSPVSPWGTDPERTQPPPLRSSRGPAQDALGHRGSSIQPSWEEPFCPKLKDGLVVTGHPKPGEEVWTGPGCSGTHADHSLRAGHCPSLGTQL